MVIQKTLRPRTPLARGATITPRAVVQAVYNALQYFEANREQLLELETEELARG